MYSYINMTTKAAISCVSRWMPTVCRQPTHLRRGYSSVKTIRKKTYASARSKLSFITPVTFLIISKLSVAIFSAIPPAPRSQTPHSRHSHRLRRKTHPRYPQQPWQCTAKQRATSPSTKAPISYPHPRLHPSPAAPPSDVHPAGATPPSQCQQQKPSPSPSHPTPLHPQHHCRQGQKTPYSPTTAGRARRRLTCPPLRQLQNKPPHSPPRQLWQRTPRILGYQIHYLPDGMHDIPTHICEFAHFFQDGLDTGVVLGRAWTFAVKSRRMRIWVSIWAVAYC